MRDRTFKDTVARTFGRDDSAVHHPGQSYTIVRLNCSDRSDRTSWSPLTMSTNSCTSPSPSVRILPISSEIKAPRSSRCPRRARILDAVGQHGHGSVCIPLRRAPLVSASVSLLSWVRALSSRLCMRPVSVQGHARPLQGSPRVSCTVSNASGRSTCSCNIPTSRARGPPRSSGRHSPGCRQTQSIRHRTHPRAWSLSGYPEHGG